MKWLCRDSNRVCGLNPVLRLLDLVSQTSGMLATHSSFIYSFNNNRALCVCQCHSPHSRTTGNWPFFPGKCQANE